MVPRPAGFPQTGQKNLQLLAQLRLFLHQADESMPPFVFIPLHRRAAQLIIQQLLAGSAAGAADPFKQGIQIQIVPGVSSRAKVSGSFSPAVIVIGTNTSEILILVPIVRRLAKPGGNGGRALF